MLHPVLHYGRLKKVRKSTEVKTKEASRVFKTGWFSKEARKAKITDSELCSAIRQVMQGQADNLGGGVYKKRLNDNMYRSIVLAKASRHWIFAYLYAKKDRENITPDELTGFKKLAKDYARATASEIVQLLKDTDLLEICHDC